MHETVFESEKLRVDIKYWYQEGESKLLYAALEISNLSSDTILYSNQNLFAICGNDSFRAYKNLIASHAIDFSSIKISPSTSFREEVYFSFDTQINDTLLKKIIVTYSDKSFKK